MMQYEVMSEQEANEARHRLLPEGIYDGTVVAAQERVSANGNPMLDITLAIADGLDSVAHTVRDFLVFTKPMMWKVIRFAKATGLLKEYESGKLNADVVLNRDVKVRVNIENGSEIPSERLNGRPAGTRYPDKNKIVDYLWCEQKPKVVPANEDLNDEDLPF